MLFDTVTQELKENKRRREAGEIIAIPFPFKRFSKFVPGIQRGRYIICTANTKVGKTKFADFMFLYSPLDYILECKRLGKEVGIKVRINYFCLEMSKMDKMKEAISYYLFTRKGIVMPPDKMESIYDDHILSDKDMTEIEDLKEIFKFFEECVTFHDYVSNPYGIYKEIRRSAHSNGYYVDVDGNKLDVERIERAKTDKDLEEIKKIYEYKQNDPEIYFIDMIDHFSLVTPEKHHITLRDPLREAIKELSSRYCRLARDRWGRTVVGIQQQANAQESTENFKLNKLRPSGAGLADCKDTQRDVDMMLGLFAPSRHRIESWNNYNIERLGDFYRELSVVLNRRGNAIATNLWFNGASNYFEELPRPDDVLNMEKIYNKSDKIKNN